MARIHIIGMGMGNEELLTVQAQRAIDNCAVLIGDKRLLSGYEHTGKILHLATRAGDVVQLAAQYEPEIRIGVLVSGDVGFYSLAKTMLEKLTEPAELYCGINSLQYFASKLQIPWQDSALVSMHGRSGNILAQLRAKERVFLLTGGQYSVHRICEILQEYDLGELQVAVGERLGYHDEGIVRGTAAELATMKFDDLSVMVLFRNDQVRPLTVHGLADEEFIRDKAPMTKQEVRTVSIAKLAIKPTDIIYDIGAGTGSVALEMALQAVEGHVYAVERMSAASDLIKKNMHKFQVQNLTIINSYAPKGLEDLPVPDKIFIGGSGGNMGEILDYVYARNPLALVVLNCITMESVSECVEYYKNKPYSLEFTHMAVARSRKVGSYNMMMGANPVYIIQAVQGREEHEQRGE